MKQTKFFAILLCVCLLMTVLVACEKELTAEEMVAKAALSALEQPYALTTTVNYSCDDPNMKEVFAQMSGMEMTIYMDGTNFAMDMAVYGQSVNYVFVDKTMYLNMGDMKVCCELTAEEAQEALGTSASGVTDLAGFANVTTEKDEDGNDVLYIIPNYGLNDGDQIVNEVNGPAFFIQKQGAGAGACS